MTRKSPRAAPPPGKVKPGGRVLILEDDPLLTDLMLALLRPYKVHVDTTDDGRRALLLLGQSHYHMVLVDLRLPGMSGRDVFLELGRTDANQARVVVFVTGDSGSTDTLEFLEKSGASVLFKPFRVKDFEKLADRYLGKPT